MQKNTLKEDTWGHLKRSSLGDRSDMAIAQSTKIQVQGSSQTWLNPKRRKASYPPDQQSNRKRLLESFLGQVFWSFLLGFLWDMPYERQVLVEIDLADLAKRQPITNPNYDEVGSPRNDFGFKDIPWTSLNIEPFPRRVSIKVSDYRACSLFRWGSLL